MIAERPAPPPFGSPGNRFVKNLEASSEPRRARTPHDCASQFDRSSRDASRSAYAVLVNIGNSIRRRAKIPVAKRCRASGTDSAKG